MTDAILEGRAPKETLGELLQFVRAATDDDAIHIDADVARSEQAHRHRNTALAEFMAAHDNMRPPAPRRPNGNSHLGTIAMERLAAATDWSVFS